MRDRTEQLYYSCRWQEVKSYLRNFGEFYSNQIEHAATIVLSRTQSMTDEKLKEAVHLIREENPDASIITTPWDKLDGEVIRKAVEQTSKPTDLLKKACLHQEHYHHGDGCCHHGHHHDEECCHHSHHEDGCCHGHHHDHEGHHHADEIFTSWGTETAEKYERTEIERFLDALTEEHTYALFCVPRELLKEWMEHGWNLTMCRENMKSVTQNRITPVRCASSERIFTPIKFSRLCMYRQEQQDGNNSRTFTGFLDSGKTTLIREALHSPDFLDYNQTLLIVCEEGMKSTMRLG